MDGVTAATSCLVANQMSKLIREVWCVGGVVVLLRHEESTPGPDLVSVRMLGLR